VFVREAWGRGQPLSVHGWVYSLSTGLITDLNVTVTNAAEASALWAGS
jgi:carbonic anhydrase